MLNVLTIVALSSAFECFGAILCQHTFWRLRWGEINLVFKTDLIYSLKKMGSSEIDKENIITVTMEELTKEERRSYLLVEEHVKAQFLKGFKKDHDGLIKSVEEFVLPSVKLNKDKIQEIPNVSLSPSDMFDKMSHMMDQKSLLRKLLRVTFKLR